MAGCPWHPAVGTPCFQCRVRGGMGLVPGQMSHTTWTKKDNKKTWQLNALCHPRLDPLLKKGVGNLLYKGHYGTDKTGIGTDKKYYTSAKLPEFDNCTVAI